VPIGDRKNILRLTKSALMSDESDEDEIDDRTARNEIMMYFADLVAERRKTPGSDPISLMAGAKFNGRYMPDEDIILNCYSLILGGNQTTRLTMIGAVHAFRQNPAQWRVLKEGQVTLESACDEALRWTTPAMHFGRIALTSAELSDQSIAPGTWLPYGFLLATVMRRHSPSLTGSI